MGNRIGYERIIFKKLSPILDLFDYVVIDMPPATNLTSMNSYTFPNAIVVIPVLLSLLSLDSMKQMLDTLDEVREAYNTDLKLGGIVICRDNIEISKHAHDCARVLHESYGQSLCPETFRHSVHYTNSSLLGQSIKEYLEINHIKDKNNLKESIDTITKYILHHD
jgi:chromosome partitioning protein